MGRYDSPSDASHGRSDNQTTCPIHYISFFLTSSWVATGSGLDDWQVEVEVEVDFSYKIVGAEAKLVAEEKVEEGEEEVVVDPLH